MRGFRNERAGSLVSERLLPSRGAIRRANDFADSHGGDVTLDKRCANQPRRLGRFERLKLSDIGNWVVRNALSCFPRRARRRDCFSDGTRAVTVHSRAVGKVTLDHRAGIRCGRNKRAYKARRRASAHVPERGSETVERLTGVIARIITYVRRRTS